MPSLIYMSMPDDLARGAIDFDTDTFWGMLVTSGYAENQDTHTKRSDVTSEVSATGYSAGGQAISVSVTKNTGANTVTITFAQQQWTITGSLTARKQVVYKRRGGAASADELVFVNDFGSDVTATNDTFTVAQSTITFTVP